MLQKNHEFLLDFYRKLHHLPDSQCWMKFLHYTNYLFQAFDDKVAIEMILDGDADIKVDSEEFQASNETMMVEKNVMGKTDIKVDSEEFCDVNDDQANNDGNRWIIICLSRVVMLNYNSANYNYLL